jgi:hypothetical protein
METRRGSVKDMLRHYLDQWFGELPDSSYEHACNLADCIFYALGISEEEQDRPPEIPMPRRLPIVLIHGKRYFLDMMLKQYRRVTNPNDSINF